MPPTSEAIPISVLIRTFNSVKSLDRLLSGLKRGPGDEYIVVDSCSTDATLTVAANYGAEIIKAPLPFNYSKSLNLGFCAARNPWVLVISSHSVPMVPDLLEAFRAAIAQLPAGTVVIYGPNTLNGRGRYDDDKVRIYTPQNHPPVESFCTNGNTLYRRSAWEENPFTENLRTGEDRAWLLEALQKGRSICLAAGARTMNRSVYSLGYMFRKGYSESRSHPSPPLPLTGLGLALGSLIKSFLLKGMPFGNLTRYSAHYIGAFFGTRQKTDNTPGK